MCWPDVRIRAVGATADELTNDVLYQLGALDGLCRVAGTRVRYVRPHDALYNTCVTDDGQARAVVQAVKEYDDSLPILGLPGSVLLRHAERAGLRPVSEGFVDRGYRPDGLLVPRSDPGALVTDVDAVVERSVRLATAGEMVAVDGTVLRMAVSSLCVHGDTPGARGPGRSGAHGTRARRRRRTPLLDLSRVITAQYHYA